MGVDRTPARLLLLVAALLLMAFGLLGGVPPDRAPRTVYRVG